MNPTLRTFGLFTLLTLLFVGIGYVIGVIYGGTVFSLIIFLGIAIVINTITYFLSSKIVLWSYHAKIVTEKEEPRLYRIVKKVAEKAKVPMPKVAIVPVDVPNAFATGRNPKNAVVCATRGLLRMLKDDELEAVIGHEMGHVKDRDILVMSIAATIAGALSFMARAYFWRSLFSDRDREESWLVYIILALAAFAAVLIQLAISRQREFKADEQSARITGKPYALISALQKIEDSVRRRPLTQGNPASASLFIVNPFRGESIIRFFSTHPPTSERIKRLKEIARELKK